MPLSPNPQSSISPNPLPTNPNTQLIPNTQPLLKTQLPQKTTPNLTHPPNQTKNKIRNRISINKCIVRTRNNHISIMSKNLSHVIMYLTLLYQLNFLLHLVPTTMPPGSFRSSPAQPLRHLAESWPPATDGASLALSWKENKERTLTFISAVSVKVTFSDTDYISERERKEQDLKRKCFPTTITNNCHSSSMYIYLISHVKSIQYRRFCFIVPYETQPLNLLYEWYAPRQLRWCGDKCTRIQVCLQVLPPLEPVDGKDVGLRSSTGHTKATACTYILTYKNSVSEKVIAREAQRIATVLLFSGPLALSVGKLANRNTPNRGGAVSRYKNYKNRRIRR